MPAADKNFAYSWPMSFPTKLLNDNEEVVLDLRPHWWFLAGPVATLVAAVALGIVVLAKVAEPYSFGENFLRIMSGILVVAALVWMLGRYMKWSTTNFVITSDRLVYRHGVFAKSGIEIPLDKVMNVIFNQSIFERVLGAGDLIIESGGQDGQQQFTDIRKPAVVQNEIYRQMEANENRKYDRIGRNAADQHSVPVAPAPAAMPADTAVLPTIPEQIRQIDELRAQGILSEEEFQAKKAELLGRM